MIVCFDVSEKHASTAQGDWIWLLRKLEWLEKEVCPLKTSCEVDTLVCLWTQGSYPEASGSKQDSAELHNRQNPEHHNKGDYFTKENVSFVAEIVIAEMCSGCFLSRPYQFAIYFVN